MAKWNGYHLTIGPGGREPAAVADELRAALPAAAERAADRSDPDVEHLVGDRDDAVWTANGVVHWNTRRVHRPISDLLDGLVPALDVPAEWALGVHQHEAEWHGDGELFAWIDGAYRPVDEYAGRFGRGARDVVDYFEREWGVPGAVADPTHRETDRPTASAVDSAAPAAVVDGDPPSTDPLVAAVRERVDRSVETRSAALSVVDDPEAVDALVTALEDPEPTTRRRAGAAAFVVAAERPEALDPLAPPLYRALSDDAARLVSAATIRRLEPSTETVATALTDGGSGRRLAAARHCELTAGSGTYAGAYERIGAIPAPLLEPLREAASAPSVRLRRAATGAFRWLLENEDVGEPPIGAAPTLLSATDDEDPRVRINATVAAAMLAFQHGADEHRFDAADAVRRAVTDPDPVVRSTVDEVLFRREEAGHTVASLGDGVPGRLIADLVEVADDGPIADRVRTAPGYVARYHPELLAPVADRLVARGWGPDGSALARETVTTLAAERPGALAPAVDDLREAVDADRHADAAETALERIRGADHTRRDERENSGGDDATGDDDPSGAPSLRGRLRRWFDSS